MRKLIVLFFVVSTMVSCGTSKVVKASKKEIKGNWTLNNIAYSEYGTFRITFFNDATKDCLENSNWEFIPNNNSGTYSINKDDCFAGERNFVFTIQEVDPETGLYDFLLKPTDKKQKSETNTGYRLKLVSLSESEMQWQQMASIDGKNIKINMNFTKIVE